MRKVEEHRPTVGKTKRNEDIMTEPSAPLQELSREQKMGGVGTIRTDRELRQIDLSDFDARREQIADDLWAAATDIGFFQLVNHGIPEEVIDGAFTMSRAFFALPGAVKAQYALRKELNSGYEFRSQVRPSIGVPDEKETYQMTAPHMAGLWPSEDELAGFREAMIDFRERCWSLAMRVLSVFAERLGRDPGFFERAHDPASPQHQSTLRLLHYFPMVNESSEVLWRGGAHTDFDVLTLLFQREGQGGLEVLPGKELEAQEWTPVPPSNYAITCNIGDMLERWSDEVLPSNFHRVRGPGPGQSQDERYSIAYFAQADRDVLMESASGSWEPITAGDYLLQRIKANYGG